MGIAERKERQRQELREQMLTAARAIVVRDGFEALTMRKIADAVEYSPATLYLYFENREAIGRELCRSAFEHLLTYVEGAAAIADPCERLKAIGRGYARYGFANAEEYKLLFMTDAAFMEAVFVAETKTPDDPGERAFAFLETTVTDCQAAGAFAAGNPALVAEALWSAVHGVVSLAATCRMVLGSTPEALVEAQLDALVRGFAARPCEG